MPEIKIEIDLRHFLTRLCPRILPHDFMWATVTTSLPQIEDDFALWYEDIVRIAERISAAAH